MLRWPRKCCSARVSTPSLANLNPQRKTKQSSSSLTSAPDVLVLKAGATPRRAARPAELGGLHRAVGDRCEGGPPRTGGDSFGIAKAPDVILVPSIVRIRGGPSARPLTQAAQLQGLRLLVAASKATR